MLVDGIDGGVVALVIRGDHEFNAVKSQKFAGVANPLKMAGADRIRRRRHGAGIHRPGRFQGPIYVDHAAAHLADFVCGANEKDMHYRGVNWGRDLPDQRSVDIRNVQAGDPSPTGRGSLQIARGIEVGHIFQLGQLYSAAMNASVLDEQGKALTMYMGCYGIGVTRVVAAAIEQNHDANGIYGLRRSRRFKWCWCPSIIRNRPRSRRPRMLCIATSTPRASMCCWTTATRGPASNSPIPSFWGFPIA